MPQKSINELQEIHLQLMAVAMDKHFHRFFGDFDALLAEQVQKFNIQEFERFITTFQEYKLRDDTYQTADDVVQFFTLLTARPCFFGLYPTATPSCSPYLVMTVESKSTVK